MAKWADYVITGIWLSDEHISYVMLHEDHGDDINFPGQKYSREQAVKLLKSGKSIVTAEWNYEKSVWSRGAVVDYENRNNVDYLRTIKDGTVVNNLRKMIRMTYYF